MSLYSGGFIIRRIFESENWRDLLSEFYGILGTIQLCKACRMGEWCKERASQKKARRSREHSFTPLPFSARLSPLFEYLDLAHLEAKKKTAKKVTCAIYRYAGTPSIITGYTKPTGNFFIQMYKGTKSIVTEQKPEQINMHSMLSCHFHPAS